MVAGKDATIAILGALLAREVSPEPLAVQARHLEIALVHSAVASLVNVGQNVLVSGADAGRWGNAHPNLVPYQLFRAADREVVIAVGSDGQWRALCRALALETLGDEPALATNAGRLAARERVVGAIASRVAEHPAAHWLDALASAGVPCGVVRSVKEALREIPATATSGVAPAVPGTVRLPPPGLDEHGDVIRRSGWEAFALLRTG